MFLSLTTHSFHAVHSHFTRFKPAIYYNFDNNEKWFFTANNEPNKRTKVSGDINLVAPLVLLAGFVSSESEPSTSFSSELPSSEALCFPSSSPSSGSATGVVGSGKFTSIGSCGRQMWGWGSRNTWETLYSRGKGFLLKHVCHYR